MKQLILATIVLSHMGAALADDFGAGNMQLRTEHGNLIGNAIMLSAQANIDISAMTATVSMTQIFENTSQAWVHGTYVFPLPDDAAVNDFSFQIGERVIQSEVQEKQTAKKQFTHAKRKGQQAALMDQNRPNLFRLSLANIPPGEQVTAKITYVQTVAYQQGVFYLRLPTTLTPRYIPGKPFIGDNELDKDIVVEQEGQGWAFNTDQVPDASHITPPQMHSSAMINPIEIRARITPGFELANIASASHKIEWQAEDGNWLVKLAKKSEPMNRDFTLSWAPQIGAEPAAAVFVEDKGADRYVSLMLMPPQPALNANLETLARDIVFVIDSSGSMAGESMRQAKRSLQYALSRLSSNDRFEVIDFDHSTRALFRGVKPVNNQRLAQAIRFVEGLDAKGGTEIAAALGLAFSNAAEQKRLRQIVFITDGSVGNEDALLALIHQQLGNSRLFTVGIGAAPNSYFMRKAAEFGRGNFTYVGALDEVEHKMSALFAQLESPLLRDIKLQWAGDSVPEIFPAAIPDLYLGEPLVLKVKTQQLSANVAISGMLNNRRWQRTINLPERGAQVGMASLWARAKIEKLMDELHTGTAEELVKPAILSLALEHKLASKYTSFIAIDSKVVRPEYATAKDTAISNLMPAGTTMPAPWPNTATSAMLSFYLGLPFLLLGLLLWKRQRAL